MIIFIFYSFDNWIVESKQCDGDDDDARDAIDWSGQWLICKRLTTISHANVWRCHSQFSLTDVSAAQSPRSERIGQSLITNNTTIMMVLSSGRSSAHITSINTERSSLWLYISHMNNEQQSISFYCWMLVFCSTMTLIHMTSIVITDRRPIVSGERLNSCWATKPMPRPMIYW